MSMVAESVAPAGKRIGLALSGGGFRATLYHLGGIRFLHDAGILSNVTHISSVSGGSILAAHMVMNWDRYTGSDEDFESAAAEIIEFSRVDVRNRILRRLPLALPIYLLGRITHVGNQRKFTRAGLLEWHYDKYLYHDKCMYELEGSPELNILTTNVSQGCLCSFTPSGFTFLRRGAADSTAGEHIRAGLTPVSLAVTASSAFPGFFPPVDISNQEIGAEEGEFHTQSFTDGGAYDNLGIRIFKWIKESWLERNDPIRSADILDPERFLAALTRKEHTVREPAIEWLATQLQGVFGESPGGENPADLNEPNLDKVVETVSNILKRNKLYLENDWRGIKPIEKDAATLLSFARSSGRELDQVNHLWLNRQLFERALNNIASKPLIRRFDGGFDTILVSDAGQQFRVVARPRFSWLFGTAIRAADILYDRVGQLEVEAVEDDPSYLFAGISDIVERSDDETVPHSVVQRRLAHIRTDFDRFSPTEISALVRHGYCTFRNSCKARPEVFGTNLPENSPWDPAQQFQPQLSCVRKLVTKVFPTHAGEKNPPTPISGPVPHTTDQARRLQRSAQRRLWTTMLDRKDWPTYIYVPILAICIFVFPFLFANKYKWSVMDKKIVEAIALGNEDFRTVHELLRDGPKPLQSPRSPQIVESIGKPDYSGFDLLKDVRIIDLRRWKEVPSGDQDKRSSPAVWVRRTRIRRKPEHAGNDRIRFQYRTTGHVIDMRCLTEGLNWDVRRAEETDTVHGRKTTVWEIEVVVDKIPEGDAVDIVTEAVFWNGFQGKVEEWAGLRTDAPTDFSGMWILLPEKKPYGKYELRSYQTVAISERRSVIPVHEIDHPDNSIIGWSVTNAKEGYTYECRWTW